MGLVGFVIAAAYFRRDMFPRKYLRQMVEATVLICIVGFVLSDFIDKAAVFGGLASGLLLGCLFLRKKRA